MATGCSSGIGEATTQLLLSVNAKVVGGDLNPPAKPHDNLLFVKTNVTSWPSLLNLFKTAVATHGRIDHVFSNAGITGRADYLTDTLDANGDIQEPSNLTYDIDLRGMVNTSYLGLTYLRRQSPSTGSIVCTASAASFQRFRIADYTAAKHGVLGWMRGVVPNLQSQNLPIRINAISPSWTITGMTPTPAVQALRDLKLVEWQGPEVVARSVAVLMADQQRQGQLIYSVAGRYYEIEEAALLPAARGFIGVNDEDKVIEALHRVTPDIGRV